MPNPEMYQRVVVLFSDGETAVFTGRAVAYPGDKRTIKKIEFTEPHLLPEGCEFAAIVEAPDA